MLCMQNSGKYLSKTFERLNNEGMEDEANLSQSEKDFAEISGENGQGRYRRETYEVDNISLDNRGSTADGNNTQTKYIDIRARPECGDAVVYKKKW